MAGIPLPALAIHGPDPNEMANAFGQAIRLRQAAQAQQQNAQNDAQRNAIFQQDANTQAQAQQFKMQQLQQAQKNAAIANSAWQASTQGGKFDLDAFSKHLTDNGYRGDVIGTAKDAQAVYSAKQTAEDNAQKSQQDKEAAIKSIQQQAAAVTDPALADKVFMYGISKLGDAKDQQFFGSLSPQQRQGIIQSQAAQKKPVTLSPGQIAVAPDAYGKYQTVAQGGPSVTPPTTKTLMVNGQPHVMGYDGKTKGYTIDYGLAQPNYGQQILPTKFTTMTGADGLPHKFQWNPQTNSYSTDMGVDANGAFGHSVAQASVIKLAGNGLINDIQANRKKLGNMDAILNSAFLGTPLADPKSQELAAEISSFAALQPALHGFRGSDALREFKKLIGGLPNNPDALAAGINGILKTAGAFSTAAGGKTASASPSPGTVAVTAPNGKVYHFGTQADADKFKKLAGIK